jgi:hypothetical protein
MDYLPKGQNSNAEYYSSLLLQLKYILKENTAVILLKVLVLSRQFHESPGTCKPEETVLPALSMP